MRRARGISLATTLAAAAIGMTLVLTLAAVAFSDYNVSLQLGVRARARNLADSAVHKAMAELLVNPEFGRAFADRASAALELGDEPLDPPPGAGFWHDDGQGGRGVVTFDPAEARRLGILCSINNLDSDTPRPGHGRLVPPGMAQILGVGRSGGVTRVVEVLLHVPPYPFVVGSSGPVRTLGGVLVGRIPEPEGGQLPQVLGPGDLGSNSDQAEALDLGPLTEIMGDALAVGSIRLQEGAVVKGQVRPHEQPVPIPRLELADYDPLAQHQANVAHLGGVLASETLSGPAVTAGNLRVDGGLTLDDGWLYVKGDLRVSGGLRGRGAVIVEGKTEIEGGVDLQAENSIALVGQGDVTLRGAGAQSTWFRGQVYTEGNFSVDRITVLGSFVANSQQPGGSQVTLHDARIAHDPRPVALNVTVVTATAPAATAPGPTPDPAAGPAPTPDFVIASSVNGMGNASVPVIMLRDGELVTAGGQHAGTFSDVQPGDDITIALEDGNTLHVSATDGSATVTDPAGNPTNTSLIEPALLQAPVYASGSLSSSAASAPGPAPPSAWDPAAASAAPAQVITEVRTVSFEFNQFLAPMDKIRVLLWREL